MKAANWLHLLTPTPVGDRRSGRARPLLARRKSRPIPGAAWWAMALLAGGALVFGAGAAADVVYHAFPGTGAAALLEPLAGSEGARAHLITLAGMLVITGGLLVRGLSHVR